MTKKQSKNQKNNSKDIINKLRKFNYICNNIEEKDGGMRLTASTLAEISKLKNNLLANFPEIFNEGSAIEVATYLVSYKIIDQINVEI